MGIKAGKICLTHTVYFNSVGSTAPPGYTYGGDLTAFATHIATGMHYVQDCAEYDP